MNIKQRKLKGFFEISSTALVDSRGFLARTYDQKEFDLKKIDRHWVQESLSHTDRRSTVRGLHVQFSPYTETKLISIYKGKMMWVVVDVRKDSSTFGQWDSVILSDEKHNSLFVESGFAHGCLSLSDNCDLIIKSDRAFIEGKGVGIKWNDPVIGIDWGLHDKLPIISDRDSNYLSFNDFVHNHGYI
ncbi:MAG: dTDP-4-dehydrorhamnose 3,5-epimerase family protein [Candidatus Thioglobus sp.]